MNGLTVDDVNAMQDEMNKIGDDEVNPDEDAEKLAADEAAKQAEAKVAEEEAAKKALEGEGSKVEEKKEVEDFDPVRDLKEQLREAKSALEKLGSDYQKLQKIMVDKGVITDEEVELTKAEEKAAKEAYEARQEKLLEIVSVMEVNPAYANVREVCTQSNLDDIVDGFARYYAKENGVSVEQTAKEIMKEIWSKPNPYKEMYDLITKYHPKYAKKEEEKKEDEKEVVKEKEVKKVNESAADIGTGGSGAGGAGWTSAKIDALDEMELKTVPKDIYEKYLAGTLK